MVDQIAMISVSGDEADQILVLCPLAASRFTQRVSSKYLQSPVAERTSQSDEYPIPRSAIPPRVPDLQTAGRGWVPNPSQVLKEIAAKSG